MSSLRSPSVSTHLGVVLRSPLRFTASSVAYCVLLRLESLRGYSVSFQETCPYCDSTELNCVTASHTASRVSTAFSVQFSAFLSPSKGQVDLGSTFVHRSQCFLDYCCDLLPIAYYLRLRSLSATFSLIQLIRLQDHLSLDRA